MKLSLHAQMMLKRPLHFFIKEHNAVLALRFCTVKSHLDLLKKNNRRIAVFRITRNTEACRNAVVAVLVSERMSKHSAYLCNVCIYFLFILPAGNNKKKFVSAHASERNRSLYKFKHVVHNFRNKRISDLMTERIIYHFKVVKVTQHDRKNRNTVRTCDQIVYAQKPFFAVRNTRQIISKSPPVKLLNVCVELGYFALDNKTNNYSDNRNCNAGNSKVLPERKHCKNNKNNIRAVKDKLRPESCKTA